MTINRTISLVKRYCVRNNIDMDSYDRPSIKFMITELLNMYKYAALTIVISTKHKRLDVIWLSAWVNKNKNYQYISIDSILKSERKETIDKLLK
jgi:hypothetical protein